jgi:hypothetical protein
MRLTHFLEHGMIARMLSVLLLLSACVMGCGSAAVAPVKGRVLCNGKPVKEATVTFSPMPKSEKDLEAGKPGQGFSDAEGFFVLTTYHDLDGAQIGEHNVHVVLDDTNPAPCKKQMRTKLVVKAGQNDFDLEMTR